MPGKHQQIAILDFGSQYTHLIARRFRQLGVLSKLYPTDFDLTEVENLIGVVLSGSPGSVGENQYPFNSSIFKLNLPILGLCYGHQLIARHFGGRVEKGQIREYGLANLQVGQSELFEGLKTEEVVWMSHGDSVTEVPQDFQIIGGTADCPIAAMASSIKKIYGLQFHPEVTHTPKGTKILENFAYKICGAKGDWKIADWQKDILQNIQRQVKDRKVFLLVSGGVDSSVCFALLEKALGADKVYGLHVDTGLMRKNEVKNVKEALIAAGFKNLRVKEAASQFLEKLAGIINPEEKRKIIGQLFLDIQEQISGELNLNPEEWILGQGTIYPDTIETGGTKHADRIKTHHNRVDKIQELIKQDKIIEPIKDLYKDEVRELGELLGLPEKIVWRQPFPGPGLAIRVLCEDGKPDFNKNSLSEVKKKLDQVFSTIKFTENLPKQASINVLPIKSVGVQGDERSYAMPAVLEIPSNKLQETNKFQNQNSKFQTIDWLAIERLSPQITNSVKEVNRVLLNVECGMWNVERGALIKASVTKERLDLLREIDAIVTEEVFKAGLERDIWQFPVVLIPFGVDGKESVVLRPVLSQEAMTARFYQLPQEVLETIINKIQALNQTSFIFYDVTNKPPGTIEWE